MKNKRHILIHPDRIEDLDAKWAKLELNKREPVRTGYTSVCRLRNLFKGPALFRRLDALFPRSFIEEKMPSRGFIIYHDMKRDWVMIMPVPPEWMHRSHVNFVSERILSLFRRFAYKASLDSTSPSTVFYYSHISPLCASYAFRLEEWLVHDEHLGDKLAYRLIPLSRWKSWAAR
jgi:hypothetical protein